MIRNLLTKVLGDPNEKELERIQPIVDEINALEPEMEERSQKKMQARTEEYRQTITEAREVVEQEYAAADLTDSVVEEEFTERLHEAEEAVMEEILPEAFAMVREASVRTTGLRHYDVQLIGGVVLHEGKIAEMKTGEGKTIAAALSLYVNALGGHGAHLVTVNDYLARRDAGWMGQIYHYLGLSTGFIAHDVSALYDPAYVDPKANQEDERLVHMRPCSRREAYEADITYGTNNEFGFDYLRDNMATDPARLVQRELHYAIIDEVDNILVDEARTPLIISGPAETPSDEYQRFAQLVRGFKRNTAGEEEPPTGDFDIDDRTQSITLTEPGIARVEQMLPEIDIEAGESIYDPQYYELTHYIENALKAQFVFQRDKDYIVQNGDVVIVDEFTGRLMPGRRWSDGLHQAVEAKEGVQVQRENVTMATITLQNLFRMYYKLAGMTGTAKTEEDEFARIYGLDVIVIPTNEPVIRDDHADQVYKSINGKFNAVVREIHEMHQQNRPALVGTTSVETSELLSSLLERRRLDHEVLNAKRHTREAAIVAQAGRPGAVTIATNMAGRGTDIILGGNAEGLASRLVEERCFERDDLERLAAYVVGTQADKARRAAEHNQALSPDLIDGLEDSRQEYKTAIQEVDDVGLTAYLAKDLQAGHDVDWDTARQVVRALSDGSQDLARRLLEQHPRAEVIVAETHSRLMDLMEYRAAQDSGRGLSDFLAHRLYEAHYNARAALVRAVLAGRLERAQGIVEETPALSPELIGEIQAVKEQCERDQQRVIGAGGLHVIGTERHDARRIDNQLRGRSGRQGDPGSSRFYLSLEDELMRRFGGDRVKGIMERVGLEEDIPIESGIIDRTIENAQEKVEGYNFDIRKHLVEYDDVVSKQREVIYKKRRAILEGKIDTSTELSTGLDEEVKGYFRDEIADMLDRYLVDYAEWMAQQIDQAVHDFTSATTDEVNLDGVLQRLRGILPAVEELDYNMLVELDDHELRRELNYLIAPSVDERNPVRLLSRDAQRIVALMPRMPELGSGQLNASVREKAREAFFEETREAFKHFTGGYLEQSTADDVWADMADAVDTTFDEVSVANLTAAQQRRQQQALAENLRDAVNEAMVRAWSELTEDQIESIIMFRLDEMLDQWCQLIGNEDLETFERWFLLSTIDDQWRQYLTAMDDLRQGITLETFAQRDPLVEFKRRGFAMFAELQENIHRSVVYDFFIQLPNHQAWVEQQRAAAQMRERAAMSEYEVEQRQTGGVTVRREMPKVGRNDPCPCGSGKKYKHCHGRPQKQEAAAGSGRRRRRRRRR
ncbi:MAG: Protein translocase subunit SecA [Anaerolineales bacterium]|nr:Protein translocase subunit SecA [Anaerolineales bacterium]